jgi:hypothetical protein
LDRRLDGPQSWSKHYRDEKNIFPLLEMEPKTLGSPDYSLVLITIPNELSQLPYLYVLILKFLYFFLSFYPS